MLTAVVRQSSSTHSHTNLCSENSRPPSLAHPAPSPVCDAARHGIQRGVLDQEFGLAAFSPWFGSLKPCVGGVMAYAVHPPL